MATLELGKYSFDPHGGVGHYTGKDGPQQSAEEVIWSLPKGLQGYQLLGAWSQRRVDACVQIVRDPGLQRHAADAAIKKSGHGQEHLCRADYLDRRMGAALL